jgi:hypothetical protein
MVKYYETFFAGWFGDLLPIWRRCHDSSFFSGDRQHFDSLKAGEVERLNALFSRAIHRTACDALLRF